MDGGAWRVTVHGVAESWTQLSDQTIRQLAGGAGSVPNKGVKIPHALGHKSKT